MKKLTPWCLAALATMAPLGALGGLSGALAGHTAVLAVTVGIFFGTLSLGRTPSAPSVGSRSTATPIADLTAQIDVRRSLRKSTAKTPGAPRHAKVI